MGLRKHRKKQKARTAGTPPVALGAKSSASEANGTERLKPRRTTVRANQFVLLDDQGAIRAILTANSSGAHLLMFDQRERVRVRVAVENDGYAGLDVYGDSGTQVSEQALGEASGVTENRESSCKSSDVGSSARDLKNDIADLVERCNAIGQEANVQGRELSATDGHNLTGYATSGRPTQQEVQMSELQQDGKEHNLTGYATSGDTSEYSTAQISVACHPDGGVGTMPLVSIYDPVGGLRLRMGFVRGGGSWLGHYVDDKATWTFDSIDGVVGPDRARPDSHCCLAVPSEVLGGPALAELVLPWVTANADWPLVTSTGRLRFLGDGEILKREFRRGDWRRLKSDTAERLFAVLAGRIPALLI